MKKKMKLVTICACAIMFVTLIATSGLGTRSALAEVANQSAESLITTTSNGKTISAFSTDTILLPAKHTLKIGEVMEWNPKPDDGSWEYYTKYLEHIPGSKPTQFKAKAAGTTVLRYIADNKTHSIEVTIAGTAEQIGVKGLPESLNVALGDQFQLNPTPADGVWQYVPGEIEHIENSSPTAFKATKLGKTTLAYITKDGLRCHIDINVVEKKDNSSSSSSSSSEVTSSNSSSTTSSNSSSSKATDVSNLPATYKMKLGESVTWNPEPNNGKWEYNAEYLEYIVGSSPATFKAIKEGSFAVKYEYNGLKYTINVTITK